MRKLIVIIFKNQNTSDNNSIKKEEVKKSHNTSSLNNANSNEKISLLVSIIISFIALITICCLFEYESTSCVISIVVIAGIFDLFKKFQEFVQKILNTLFKK